MAVPIPGRRLGETRAACLLACIVFGLFWLVSSRYNGPAYLSDEISYLSNAARLAGYNIECSGFAHSGYSLLLAPLFRLLSDPSHIWQAVMALNAAMWSGSFLMLHRVVVHLFPERPPLHRLGAVVVAALYPTWLTMSGYAFATTAIVFIFMLSLVTALRIDLQRAGSVVPHSLAVGFLYWVHPTGLAAVAASTLALAGIGISRRRVRSLILHVALVTVLMLTFKYGLQQWLIEVGTAPGFSTTGGQYPSPLNVISHLTRAAFWRDTVVSALGQMSYLAIGSLGLAVFGFVELVRLAREHYRNAVADNAWSNVTITYVSLLIPLCMAGVILMGSVFFSLGSHSRVDYWIYGRYAEGFLLPLLPFGLLATNRRRWLPAMAGALVACGLALALTGSAQGNYNLVNTTSFWPEQLVSINHFLIWMSVGALGVFLFQVAKCEGRPGMATALALLAGTFVFSDVNAARFHQNILNLYSKPTAIVEIVRTEFEPGSCVGFNPEMPPDASLFQKERFRLHLFYLYDYAYRRMHVVDWLRDCDGPLLTYDLAPLRNVPGVTVVGREVYSGLYLVVKDSEKDMTSCEPVGEGDHADSPRLPASHSLERYGPQLADLPSKVGEYRDGCLYSDGRQGHLVYGPYVHMSAGEYRLVVVGSAPAVSSAFVDVVSGEGAIVHAAFPITATESSGTAVLVSARIVLNEDVSDLEVRMWVAEGDGIRLDGYEMTPLDTSTPSLD